MSQVLHGQGFKQLLFDGHVELGFLRVEDASVDVLPQMRWYLRLNALGAV